MAIEVVMPAMEMDQASARLLRWLKAEGDAVAKGEPLMEIETDKVTVEIEAPADGVLSGIRAAEGDDVPVGAVVALLTDGAASSAGAPEASRSAGSKRAAVAATPIARRVAAERGIDLAAVAGTGPGGAVTADDLLAIATSAAAEPPEYEAQVLSGLRRTSAERLSASYREAPHFDVAVSVDATALLAALERRAGDLSLTAAIAALVAAALTRHPQVNAHFVDGEVRVFRSIHLGVAVAVEDGLIVPVIREAAGKTPDELQLELADLVERARSGRLGLGDVGASTFTVSNLGMFGIDRFTAIVNPPEVAILAVGRVRDVPTVVDGEVVARRTVDLTLCADHRALDGAAAASFLRSLADLVLDPEPVLAAGERDGSSEERR